MQETLKNMGIAVATALSISSIGIGINTYVDVQILKNNQLEQSSMVKTTQEILSRIDKTQAVQAEIIKSLGDVVNNLNHNSGEKAR